MVQCLALSYDFHALLCLVSVSSVFFPVSSLPPMLDVCLPLSASVISPLCFPLIISPALFPPLSPHLLLVSSSVSVYLSLCSPFTWSVCCFFLCVLCVMSLLKSPLTSPVWYVFGFWFLCCILIWTLLLGVLCFSLSCYFALLLLWFLVLGLIFFCGPWFLFAFSFGFNKVLKSSIKHFGPPLQPQTLKAGIYSDQSQH